MSATTKEWIVIGVFFFFLTMTVIGEITWLVRQHWTTSGRAIAYVLITDVLGFGIACIAWFVLTLLFVMNAFGPAGTGSTPGGEVRMWLLLIVGIVFPPLEIFGIKRAFLSLLSIQTGRRAWIYSLAITILLLVALLAPPILLIYFA